MATFEWTNTPAHGGCLSCLASSNDKGFVNTLCETALMRNEMEISGYADVIFCADCLYQMGRYVGMATPADTEKFALTEYTLTEEIEKLKDEVQAWQDRCLGLIGLSGADVGIPPEVK